MMKLIALIVAATALLFAETKPQPKGTVQRIEVHGKSLEGNLEGDSPDRDVTIYLPPGYDANRNQRYPVVYLLHGYLFTDQYWTGTGVSIPGAAMPGANVPASMDNLIARGEAKPMIVVMPNAYSKYGGSMYSSSVTTGDWETYVAEDLVAYMDTHYRTIPDRLSRGLAGHSMGGYGAIRIGMKRPDVFSSLYILSACCLSARMVVRPEAMAASEAIRTREDAEKAGQGRGFGPSTNLAFAAAWSPNPDNPPLYLDLPVKDGKVRPEIVAKWAANAPLAMIDQYIPSLKVYHAIAIDVGTKDNLLASNKELEQVMTRFAVAHTYQEYEGDHTNRIADRIEMHVLPFFSDNLRLSAKAEARR